MSDRSNVSYTSIRRNNNKTNEKHTPVVPSSMRRFGPI